MKLICVTFSEGNEPIIYIKPDTCLVRNNEDFYIPEFSTKITLRLAFVIKIKKMGKNISERFAHRYYDEISAGFNLEASDLLSEKQAKGQPWDEAVSFDRSAPLGTFVNATETCTLDLLKNAKIIQTISIDELNINAIIAQLSHKFTLKIGDFIYISPSITPQPVLLDDVYSSNINASSVIKCHIK